MKPDQTKYLEAYIRVLMENRTNLEFQIIQLQERINELESNVQTGTDQAESSE